MNEKLIEFYKEFLANESNISVVAEKNGITNAECYQLVKMGERLSEQK